MRIALLPDLAKLPMSLHPVLVYDPRDPFTTVPRASVRAKPFAASAAVPGAPGSLKGVRRSGACRHPSLVPFVRSLEVRRPL